MPLGPGPGQPFDVLSDRVDARLSCRWLVVGLLLSVSASALLRLRPNNPSSLSAHCLKVCRADARERPASGLRVKQPSLKAEDHWACPHAEDGLGGCSLFYRGALSR